MVGRALAARLLCLDPDRAPEAEEPCERCAACGLFAAENHPDFHLIHRGLHKLHPDRAVRARKGLYLAVDLVRHFLIEPSMTKPATGARRVFLIRDAETMNEGAQNALLKTLEEPPGQACLILVTSSAERLLPTIRSRCQRVPFDLLPPEFVAAQLCDRWDVPDVAARSLARLADGQLGVALGWYRCDLPAAIGEVAEMLSRLERYDATSGAQTLLEIAGALAARQAESADDDFDEVGEEEGDSSVKRGGGRLPTDTLRDAVKLVLRLVAVCYRDALLVQHGAAELAHLPQHAGVVRQLADATDIAALTDRLEEVVRSERMIDGNVAPQLACERLVAALRGRLVAT
jgi:DNA polymerase-3 subunit delta'